MAEPIRNPGYAPAYSTTSPATPPATYDPPAPPPATRTSTAPMRFGPRPTSVTVLAVLLGLAAIGALLIAFSYLVAAGGADPPPDPAYVDRWQTLGVVALLSAAAAGAAAFATMARLAWGWYLALVAGIAGVVLNLYGMYTGNITVFLFGLVLAAAILAALFARDVISWFGVRFGGTTGLTGRPT